MKAYADNYPRNVGIPPEKRSIKSLGKRIFVHIFSWKILFSTLHFLKQLIPPESCIELKSKLSNI